MAALALMVPSQGWALGIRAPDQDAFATARGNAFVATANNPSAIYYNPAGITQIEGIAFRAGGYGIFLKDEYEGAGGDFETEDKYGLLPQFYSTMPIKGTPLTVGLGSYCPYGLSLDWFGRPPFRYLGSEGSVKYLTLNPELAWKINDALSVGAGVTLNYSKASLGRTQLVYPPMPPRDYFFRFKGDDFAVGANAGILWRPHPKHSFGVSYRSPTTMDYEGDSTIMGREHPAAASFRYPQNFIAGYSFRPTPKWNLEFNLDWTDWDNLNTVTLRHSAPASPLFPAAVPMNFNWESSFMFQWGVTRDLGKGFSVSAGYIFSQNSVPDDAFNPTVPDSDRHVFSVGVGRSWKRWSWDLAYQFGYGPTRTLNNSGPLPAPLVNGDYTFYSHAVCLAIGYTL